MMNRERLYLSLALLGAIAPWIGFARFFVSNGFFGDFIGALFQNGASAGFTIDLLISSIAFWIFLFDRTAQKRLDHPWAFIVVNLLIGLSCALPLALWRMERLKKSSLSESDQAAGPGSITSHSPVAMFAPAILAIMMGGPPTHASDPASVVERLFEAYRAGDVEAMLAVYSPEAVFIDVGQRHRFEGHEELAVFLRGLVALHDSMEGRLPRRTRS